MRRSIGQRSVAERMDGVVRVRVKSCVTVSGEQQDLFRLSK